MRKRITNDRAGILSATDLYAAVDAAKERVRDGPGAAKCTVILQSLA